MCAKKAHWRKKNQRKKIEIQIMFSSREINQKTAQIWLLLSLLIFHLFLEFLSPFTL